MVKLGKIYEGFYFYDKKQRKEKSKEHRSKNTFNFSIVWKREGLKKKRAKQLMMTAALVTDEEKFSPKGYWKLKKSVSRNTPQRLTSVIQSDKLVVTGEDLMKDEFKR